MENEQSQNVRAGYQIDEITYVKGGVTLNVYMCAQVGGVGRIEKSAIRSTRTKWMTPDKFQGIFFVDWSGQVS